MKRHIVLAILLATAGCTVSAPESEPPPPPPSQPPVAVAPKTEQLVIEIDGGGGLHADGWILTEKELPELIRQRQPASVVIRGWPGSNFAKALEVQATVKATGISDVTIAQAGNGG